MCVPFRRVDFRALVERHRPPGSPWTDADFPPDASSLGAHARLKELRNTTAIAWKRPRDIAARPTFFAGHGVGQSHQGKDGDCWFVAAALAFHASGSSGANTWRKVIPDLEDQVDNLTVPEKYAGLFRFRFWRMGAWTEVAVDDLLPVAEDGQLIFAGPNILPVAPEGVPVETEFWLALVEKAYAKFHGSYSAIYGTNYACHAFEELTGGLTEGLCDAALFLPTPTARRTFFRALAKDHERGALMSCAIQRGDLAASRAAGLAPFHSYAVLAFKEVRSRAGADDARRTDARCLLKLHNPWGFLQWNGDLSYLSDPRWALDATEVRELVAKKGGQFWMPLPAFLDHFTLVEVCHTPRDPGDYVQFLDTWSTFGCLEFFRPQYTFEVAEKDAVVLLELSQSETGLCYRQQILTFAVFKLEERVWRRPKRYRASLQYPFDTSFLRFRAREPGTYLVVPKIVVPCLGERILLRALSDRRVVTTFRRAGWGILGGLCHIFK